MCVLRKGSFGGFDIVIIVVVIVVVVVVYGIFVVVLGV